MNSVAFFSVWTWWSWKTLWFPCQFTRKSIWFTWKVRFTWISMRFPSFYKHWNRSQRNYFTRVLLNVPERNFDLCSTLSYVSKLIYRNAFESFIGSFPPHTKEKKELLHQVEVRHFGNFKDNAPIFEVARVLAPSIIRSFQLKIYFWNDAGMSHNFQKFRNSSPGGSCDLPTMLFCHLNVVKCIDFSEIQWIDCFTKKLSWKESIFATLHEATTDQLLIFQTSNIDKREVRTRSRNFPLSL